VLICRLTIVVTLPDASERTEMFETQGWNGPSGRDI